MIQAMFTRVLVFLLVGQAITSTEILQYGKPSQCPLPEKELDRQISKLLTNLEDEMAQKIKEIREELMKSLASSMKCCTQKELAESSVCESAACLNIASRMLSLINHHEKPCHDFYSYACGKSYDSPNVQPINPPKKVNRRIRGGLENNRAAKKFYNACRNRKPSGNQTVKAARDLVDSIGKFYDTTTINKVDISLTDMLTGMLKSHFEPFFGVSLAVDPLDPEKSMVPVISLNDFPNIFGQRIDVYTCRKTVQQPTNSTVNINEQYKKYGQCVKFGNGLKQYLSYMEEAVSKLGVLDYLEYSSDLRFKLLKDSRQRTDLFLHDLGEILPEKWKLLETALKDDYLATNLKELNSGKVFGNTIDWKKLLAGVTGKKLSEHQIIHVYHLEHIKKIIKLLETEWSFDAAGTSNVLMMIWTGHVYSTFVDPISDEENYCVETMKYLLPEISSKIYWESFSKYERSHLLNRGVSIFNEMVSTLRNSLRNLQSSNERTKKLLDKLSTLKSNELLPSSSEEDISEDALSSQHTENLINLMQMKTKRIFSFLHKSVTPEIHSAMSSVNLYSTDAVLSHQENLVYIPLGLLDADSSFTNSDLPEYIAYGHTAFQIAKSILGVFTEAGLKYDGAFEFNLNELELPTEMNLSSECLSEQLSHNFTIDKKSRHYSIMVNRDLVLGDLLTSSGAAQLAFKTYREKLQGKPEHSLEWLGTNKLTPEQAYFLRLAQSQCSNSPLVDISTMESGDLPNSLRVNLALRNSKEFAKAFHCVNNEAMITENFCSFYPN